MGAGGEPIRGQPFEESLFVSGGVFDNCILLMPQQNHFRKHSHNFLIADYLRILLALSVCCSLAFDKSTILDSAGY